MIKMIAKVLLTVFIVFSIFLALASVGMLFLTTSSHITHYTHLETSEFGITKFDINASGYTKYKYNDILFVPRLKIEERNNYPETYVILYSEDKQTIYIDSIFRGEEKINIDRNITLDSKTEDGKLYTSSILLEQKSAYTIKEMRQFFKEGKMTMSVHLKNKNIDFNIVKKNSTIWFLVD
jgi:hypothetical protein